MYTFINVKAIFSRKNEAYRERKKDIEKRKKERKKYNIIIDYNIKCCKQFTPNIFVISRNVNINLFSKRNRFSKYLTKENFGVFHI